MMSSGGYPGSSTSQILQPRRASGGNAVPLSYDRPFTALPPRRSPSPGTLRRYPPFEDYPGPRSAPPHRDYFTPRQNPNSYRPDSHAPPSPARYDGPQSMDLYPWDVPRQPPNKPATSWTDRRALTLSPTASASAVPRRTDPPPRMFEPSDAWKQTQTSDRPIIAIQSPKSVGYGDRVRSNSFRSNSPERVRGHSPPFMPRGDRYRPDQRGTGGGRTISDSYRPSYNNSSPRQPYRANYNGDHYNGGRRTSSPNGSIASSRSRSPSSRSSRSASRSRRSFSGAIIPNPNSLLSRLRDRSPSRDSRDSHSRFDDRLGPGPGLERVRGRTRTKSRSRTQSCSRSRSRSRSRSSIASSIASTHVSNRGVSPAPAAAPVETTTTTTVPTLPPPPVNGIISNSVQQQKTALASPSPTRAKPAPVVAIPAPQANLLGGGRGPSPTPSPIPGIHSARTQTQNQTQVVPMGAAKEKEKNDIAVAPLESPVPGLGNANANAVRDVDEPAHQDEDEDEDEDEDDAQGELESDGELDAVPGAENQIRKSRSASAASTLGEEDMDAGAVAKPKPKLEPITTTTTTTQMPTWDVVPTVPESPVGCAPAPAPTSPMAIVIPAHTQAHAQAQAESEPELLELSPVPPSPVTVAPAPAPPVIASDVMHATPEPVYRPEPPAARAPVPVAAAVLTADDIPRFGDAQSIGDALRTVIMTRLLHDEQTRDELIAPILMENLALAGPAGADPYAYASPTKTQDQLIDEVSARRFGLGLGLRDKDRDESPFLAARSWLAARFERRRGALSEKTEYLQAEYKALHARWRRHCDILNQQARPVEPVESALPVSGRTTRRSAATLGDTFVRSDLEMEQIIASLGYDEATDPNQLSTRNLAVIPDMISVTGETAYAFDDTNHLVENPSEYYAPRTGIHDWTDKEKEVFLDKYAAFPKQFGLIAEFLPDKTAAQCVDYYYLHKKKLIDFRRVVYQFAPNKRKGRRRTGRQKGNGLLSDIRQHDAEVHGDFDDSASYTGRPTRGRRTVAPEPRKPSSRRNVLQLEDITTATPTPEPEARPKRRRAAVSSLSVLFQDDMDEDTEEEPKKKKRGRKPKSAAAVLDDFATPIPTPPITEIEDQLPIPDPVPDPIQMWSSDDKALFLELLAQHGENFKRIAVAMPNKTSFQVADYFKANLVALNLASVLPKPKPATAGDVPIPPADIALSSAPSPSTSSGPADESAESSLNQPPQNDDIDASSVLDPNAMWDSMDPGSGARSPREPSSPRPRTGSPDPSVASGSRPASVLPPAPHMAFLTREPSVAEDTPETDVNSSRPPLSGALTSASAENQHAVKPEASEKDGIPPASSFHPAMSSLTYDPIWGYYDASGPNRPPFAPSNHYPEGGAPTHPSYPPSGPVPYAAPPPGGGPMNSYVVPYPYYIPPPYPSSSYHPYSSYKS